MKTEIIYTRGAPVKAPVTKAVIKLSNYADFVVSGSRDYYSVEPARAGFVYDTRAIRDLGQQLIAVANEIEASR